VRVIEAFVAGASIRGPGLEGLAASRPVLEGAQPLAGEPARLPPPAILPPNERRRAGQVTRLALLAAQEALEMAGLAAGSVRTVFASANGDGAVVHSILETLAGPDRHVSPTQFHNSVHNAPAGYWSIGAGSNQAATCLGCHDSSVASGLLAAAAEARAEFWPVLLCAYDAPMPEPLGSARPTAGAFGAALVLLPERGAGAMARLHIGHAAAPPAPGRDLPRNAALHDLSRGNPAARILRLLEALARQEADELSIALLDGRIDVSVHPCSAGSASSD
jgi:hypothetical protein